MSEVKIAAFSAMFWMTLNGGLLGYVLGAASQGQHISQTLLVIQCALFGFIVFINVQGIRSAIEKAGR